MDATVTVETERLVVRPAVEADRSWFVAHFSNVEFMEFSAGVLDHDAANDRFDRMVALAAHVPFAKQPVVERSSGEVVGYTGVGTVEVDGLLRLEWGWRLTTAARGRGLASEATRALLGIADHIVDGEMLCLIATDNVASRRVADKAGFRPWRRSVWPDGVETQLLTRPIGSGGDPLLAPRDA